MAWLEAHQELRDHPKTKRAARTLGISRPQMIGHLLCLWWWCLDYAETGSLADFDNDDIADAAAWEGDPDTFVSALLNCGPADRPGFLIDTGAGLTVNDWAEYGGKYVTKRAQGRERQRTHRQRNASVTQGNTGETQGNALVTRDNSVSNTPREEKRREEKIDDDSAQALTDLQVLGLFNKPMLDQFNDMWPELSGRRDWIGKAITIARDKGANSPAYALKILANALHTGKEPGYINGKSGAAKPATYTLPGVEEKSLRYQEMGDELVAEGITPENDTFFYVKLEQRMEQKYGNPAAR